ncbi:MAG: hypothetical protein AB7P69_03725 [Candidatus Binatia bacterium]
MALINNFPTIILQYEGPERDKQKAEVLDLLALRTGLSTTDIEQYALVLLGNVLMPLAENPAHTLSLVHWRRCRQAGCRCGGAVGTPEVNFRLPELKPGH